MGPYFFLLLWYYSSSKLHAIGWRFMGHEKNVVITTTYESAHYVGRVIKQNFANNLIGYDKI